MTIQFTPTLQDLGKRIQRRLDEFSSRTEFNKRLSIVLFQWVQRNFKGEGVLVGGWEDFQYGGRVLPGGVIDTSAKLLQKTGRLRQSFVPFYNRRFAGIGSDLPYSVHHEEGTSILPVRRMLPNEPEALDAAQKVLSDFEQRLARKL